MTIARKDAQVSEVQTAVFQGFMTRLCAARTFCGRDFGVLAELWFIGRLQAWKDERNEKQCGEGTG